MKNTPTRVMISTLIIIFVYIAGALSGPITFTGLALQRSRWQSHAHQTAAVANSTAASPPSSPVPTPTPVTEAATATTSSSAPKAVVNRANPFAGEKLYVDPTNPATQQATKWRTSRPQDAAQIDKIARQPVTTWLGDWISNPASSARETAAAARAAGALPVFVLYNIPLRDCGSYSAGGAGSGTAYQGWIQGVQTGTSGAKVVFVLEPDAVGGWECLSPSQKSERISLLQFAINTLTASPNHYVYLDAGNARWQSVAEIVGRLRAVGTDKLTGVSLNVSNFLTTAETRAYGAQISAQTGLHMIIDTSRNGRGPAPDLNWCNPSGRGLGELPRPILDGSSLDALLWIKYPGESDGSCGGAPTSGEWWADYALGLAQRAAF